MLFNIDIKNVAVIENISFAPENGMSVLTGETGAGKSIIIDAINLLKGERTSKSLIRSGETSARVDGEFETDDEGAKKIGDILGKDPECEVIISREMNQDNKHTIRVNGTPVNLSMLKEIGEILINSHGQHDNTSLLSVKTHIDFLDKFIGDDISKPLSDYRLVNKRYKEVASELEKETLDEQEIMRRKDMLAFQTEEIENANLYPGEDEELEKKKLMFDNANRIIENASVAYEMLYGSDSANCHDLLWGAAKKIETISDFDSDLSDIYSGLSEAGYLLDEKVRDLKNFLDHSSFDMTEARETEERLELIYTLKRKYGQSVNEILEFYEKAKEELEKIETIDEREKELQKEKALLQKKREEAANVLSDIRRTKSKNLEKKVMKHLSDLNMEKVVFEVSISQSDYSDNGKDYVEFTVCTNVGEEQKPLAKIASGGELSRIMLAIKNVLSGVDSGITVIFDEIDTGVSGSAARKIGEKLYSMSASSQVICITHLPQISSLADNHYLIRKEVSQGRTHTIVEPLSPEGRIEEIARTLVGNEVTKVALENARQLLEEADVQKKIIRNRKEE